jgi:uncharacterized protein
MAEINLKKLVGMDSKKVYQWGTARRFNSLSDYFLGQMGSRVRKVSVNAGFTCPNRDGTIGLGGCTYCNNNAFTPSYCIADKPVRQQLEEGIEFHKTRYRRAEKYLAYFQSYTNTYADAGRLQELYAEALEVPGVIGLVIGTRPDCVDDEILGVIRGLARGYYVIVEYGIESCYDKTLKAINRGHDFATSVAAIKKTAGMGIRTGGHIIFGLPGESREEMLGQAAVLSELPLDNIKFHQLQIIKDTVMARQFSEEPHRFQLFGLDEYLDFMVEFTGLLNPSFIIERIAGEAPPQYLEDGKRWGLRNDQVLALFEKKLEEADSWQGKFYRQQV